MNSLPLVSVIIPVRNGELTIDKLIEALLAQDYSRDKIEIIIVDNDSRDQTVGIIKKYPVILEQEKRLHSSYAARNKGLTVAKGEIIAFTDADCIPESDWISMGIKGLKEQSADMAGGKVSFYFSTRPTAAEYFDALTFLQNDRFIANKAGAITANLFVRASLFGEIFLFPEVVSCGDIHWTGKALRSGFSLVYVPQAIVNHPTRDFKGLVRKSCRLGTGIISGPEHTGQQILKLSYLIMRMLIPVPSKIIRRTLIDARKNHEIKKIFPAMWFVSYVCQLGQLAGMIYSNFRKRH